MRKVVLSVLLFFSVVSVFADGKKKAQNHIDSALTAGNGT